MTRDTFKTKGVSLDRGEAVAWLYEASNGCDPEEWATFTDTRRPVARQGVRNIRPLYAATPPSPADIADSFALMQQALFALWQAPNDYAARATAQTWLRPEDLAAYKAARPAASAAPSGVSDAVMVSRDAIAQAAAALDVLGRRELAAWLMREAAHMPS